MARLTKGSSSDTLHLKLGDTEADHSVELHPDIILDVAEDGTVTGIDIQNLSALLSDSRDPSTDVIGLTGRLVHIPQENS